jgi:hypothetical protein
VGAGPLASEPQAVSTPPLTAKANAKESRGLPTRYFYASLAQATSVSQERVSACAAMGLRPEQPSDAGVEEFARAAATFGDELELDRRHIRRRRWLCVKDRLARLTIQNLHRTILQPLEGKGDRRELKRDQAHPICCVGLQLLPRLAESPLRDVAS